MGVNVKGDFKDFMSLSSSSHDRSCCQDFVPSPSRSTKQDSGSIVKYGAPPQNHILVVLLRLRVGRALSESSGPFLCRTHGILFFLDLFHQDLLALWEGAERRAGVATRPCKQRGEEKAEASVCVYLCLSSCVRGVESEVWGGGGGGSFLGGWEGGRHKGRFSGIVAESCLINDRANNQSRRCLDVDGHNCDFVCLFKSQEEPNTLCATSPHVHTEPIGGCAGGPVALAEVVLDHVVVLLVVAYGRGVSAHLECGMKRETGIRMRVAHSVRR